MEIYFFAPLVSGVSMEELRFTAAVRGLKRPAVILHSHCPHLIQKHTEVFVMELYIIHEIYIVFSYRNIGADFL